MIDNATMTTAMFFVGQECPTYGFAGRIECPAANHCAVWGLAHAAANLNLQCE